MGWILTCIIYAAILVAVCLRIIFETHSSNKTLAYLLFCIFIPVFGIVFYLAFGINYWHKKRFGKKGAVNSDIIAQLKKEVASYSNTQADSNEISVHQNAELATLLVKQCGSPLTNNNDVKILVNGEQKFKELFHAMEHATHHIHLEYYIFECDDTGNKLIEILIRKAKEGVQVRFIYDDFGSPSIKKDIEKKMRNAGIQVHPFHKVHFYLLANRINYRNHRKIVVIDGKTAFTGGINVSDKYVNTNDNKLFWRDTHVRIDGPGVFYLQYIFLADWNFCCKENIQPLDDYFTIAKNLTHNHFVQVAASGPDSMQPTILYSLLQAIYLAKEEILLTTPYFIPGDSINNALCIAAQSGLKVKLLVPGKCDSRIVNAASKSNYTELLNAGVEIFLYQKGFVHSKTLVADGRLAIIGTANMDFRSFDLNFEVNAIVYEETIACELKELFFEDLKSAIQLDCEEWMARSAWEKFPEKLARLFSPVL